MISNRLYDFLKWVALVAIPALETFWLTIGKVWGLPYVTEIGTTIAAVGLLIATLIGVSTVRYRRNLAEVKSEDGNENQAMMMEDMLEEYEDEEGDE